MLIIPEKIFQATAFRKDEKPLLPETFETIVEFIFSTIQENAGVREANGWCPLREHFTPAAFQSFSRKYFREQRAKGRVGFEGPFEPL